MKKKYTTPAVEIYKTQAEQMMALSLVNPGDGGTGGSGDAVTPTNPTDPSYNGGDALVKGDWNIWDE